MKSKNFISLKNNFYLHFFALLGAVFLFAGKTVPSSNEYNYLLRLRKVYDANYLARDITFSTPTNEYWLFDHLFGLLIFVFSVETIGWLGRIGCWSVLIFALLKLGKRWEIPVWMTSLSIFLWLLIGQSIVADEWMFGGFEAKCVAYICLLFALDFFCDEHDIFPAILLGLSFAFHPVVGLYGGAAVVSGLLICRRDFRCVVKISVISGAFALIGAVPLLQMRTESVEPTIENLRYFELVKFPHHFDPFAWSKTAILLVFILMIFCLAAHFQLKHIKPPKFLIVFLTLLGTFFAAGILLRIFNQYELMKYTPTRVFAVFIPLFFLWYLCAAFSQKIVQKLLFIVLLVPILMLSIWNKLSLTGFEQIKATYESQTQSPDDFAAAFVWIKNNTSPDAMILAPPWRYDFWYLAERAEVVNYRKPIIADIGEWQDRLDEFTGKAAPENGDREDADLQNFYFALDTNTIDAAAREYKIDYLVTETEYPYEVVYSAGKVKTYHLPPQ